MALLEGWYTHDRQKGGSAHNYWQDPGRIWRICDNARMGDHFDGIVQAAPETRHCLRCEKVRHRYTAHDEEKGT